jgi:Myb-like DNA-binding domain
MATDFRQERRWKIVAAYRLSHELQKWHMSTPEEREKMQARYCRPVDREISADQADEKMAITEMQVEAVDDVLGQGSGSRTAGENIAGESADVDAEGEAEELTVQEGERVKHEPDSGKPPASVSVTPGPANESAPPLTSVDDVVQRQPIAPATAETPDQQSLGSFQNLVAVREPIFALPRSDFIVDPTTFASVTNPTDPHLFHTYLPDLPLYEPPGAPADMKSDKRFDESTPHHSRLSHQTRLLDSKPLLLSTLQPGRKRTRDGGWRDISDITGDDPREWAETRPDSTPIGCGSFSSCICCSRYLHTRTQWLIQLMIFLNFTVLFAGRKPKDVSHAAPLHTPPPPPNAEARAASFDWTPDEDSLLLTFAKQYSFNWHLIAEMFNSSTHRIPTDRRIAWDVYDRWDKKFGPGSQQAAVAAAAVAAEGPRRGADRAPKKTTKYEGPKKRLRHLSLYDALRKTQKKRETAAPRSCLFSFFKKKEIGGIF